MKFRNLTLFRFPVSVNKSFAAGAFENDLESHRLRPCGPLELKTRGFVSPYGDADEQLVRRCGDFLLFAMGTETRLLPTSVVKREVEQRIATLGLPVGGKARRAIKEQAVSELLPRAFCKPGKTFAYVDARNGWLVIDTASRRVAEEVVASVRDAIGRNSVRP